MELDNLKEAWKGHTVEAAADSKEQILSMLQKKSQRPIARIKRNLFRELIFIVIFYTSTIVYYSTTQGGRYWEIALLLLLIALLFMFYYYRKRINYYAQWNA